MPPNGSNLNLDEGKLASLRLEIVISVFSLNYFGDYLLPMAVRHLTDVLRAILSPKNSYLFPAETHYLVEYLSRYTDIEIIIEIEI